MKRPSVLHKDKGNILNILKYLHEDGQQLIATSVENIDIAETTKGFLWETLKCIITFL